MYFFLRWVNRILPINYLLLSLFILGVLSGCGGGGNGNSETAEQSGQSDSSSEPVPRDTVQSVRYPLDETARNLQLTNGVLFQQVFSPNVDSSVEGKGLPTLNIAETLQYVAITAAPLRPGESIGSVSTRWQTYRKIAAAVLNSSVGQAIANDNLPADVTARVSWRGDPEVCSSPYVYGPYTVAGAIGSALQTDTTRISPPQPFRDIINSGRFDLCVETVPPIDGFFTVTDIVVDFAECEAPEFDVTGTWSGTYSCTNFGSSNDFDNPITLTINRNSDDSYSYTDDGGASYQGTLCGSEFRFNGGLSDSYTESGTLIFNSAGSATKTSRWNSIPAGTSGGTCIDSLSR